MSAKANPPIFFESYKKTSPFQGRFFLNTILPSAKSFSKFLNRNKHSPRHDLRSSTCPSGPFLI